MRVDLDAVGMGVDHDGVQEVKDGVVVCADGSMLQTGIGRDRRALRRARGLENNKRGEGPDPMLCVQRLTSPSSQTRKTFMPALCMALHNLMSSLPPLGQVAAYPNSVARSDEESPAA
jgi:hypothetical protein